MLKAGHAHANRVRSLIWTCMPGMTLYRPLPGRFTRLLTHHMSRTITLAFRHMPSSAPPHEAMGGATGPAAAAASFLMKMAICDNGPGPMKLS